jgi:hypothetical protein
MKDAHVIPQSACEYAHSMGVIGKAAHMHTRKHYALQCQWQCQPQRLFLSDVMTAMKACGAPQHTTLTRQSLSRSHQARHIQVLEQSNELCENSAEAKKRQ